MRCPPPPAHECAPPPPPMCDPRQPSYLNDIRPTIVIPQPAQCVPLTSCLHAPYNCNTHRAPNDWCSWCLSRFLFPEQSCPQRRC